VRTVALKTEREEAISESYVLTGIYCIMLNIGRQNVGPLGVPWIQLAQYRVKHYSLLNTENWATRRFHKTVGEFHYWLRDCKLLKNDSVP
jgi:hypothetical protein